MRWVPAARPKTRAASVASSPRAAAKSASSWAPERSSARSRRSPTLGTCREIHEVAGASVSSGGRTASMASRVSTRVGSNWLPPWVTRTSRAASPSRAARYGRLARSAVKASARARSRQGRGISVPASPSGWPVPSQRSWWCRATGAASASSGTALRSSADRSGWTAIRSRSSGSRGPGWSRSADGSSSWPMSRRSEPQNAGPDQVTPEASAKTDANSVPRAPWMARAGSQRAREPKRAQPGRQGSSRNSVPVDADRCMGSDKRHAPSSCPLQEKYRRRLRVS